MGVPLVILKRFNWCNKVRDRIIYCGQLVTFLHLRGVVRFTTECLHGISDLICLATMPALSLMTILTLQRLLHQQTLHGGVGVPLVILRGVVRFTTECLHGISDLICLATMPALSLMTILTLQRLLHQQTLHGGVGVPLVILRGVVRFTTECLHGIPDLICLATMPALSLMTILTLQRLLHQQTLHSGV